MATTQSKKSKEIVNTLGLDASTTSRKARKRWWVLVLIVIAVLFLAVVSLKRKPEQTVKYRTEEVTRGDLSVIVSATGNLAPTNKVDVGCELSGIVKSVEVDYNAHVKVGQPLARLDDTKFEAAVMESKAAMASAQARLKQSEATFQLKEQNLKRLKQAHQLSGGKAPSLGELELAEADVQRSKADVTAAQAAIEQAQARLKMDQSNLSKTVIYSPINGIVLKRAVDPGQTVAAQLQTPILITLAEDLPKMELQVDVDEADVGLVQEGQTATFSVEAYPGRVFTATIAQLRYGSQITNGVVTYTTMLNVDNPDLVLRPGMTATAKIVAKHINDALLVPNAALRFTPQMDGTSGGRGLFGILMKRSKPEEESGQSEKRWKIGQGKVWVLKDGQPEAIGVDPGATDGAQTVVKDTDLQPGMQVIVDATYEG